MAYQLNPDTGEYEYVGDAFDGSNGHSLSLDGAVGHRVKSQGVGLLLLLSNYFQAASYLLLITALAYLLSQIVTGARPISRLLPLAGAASIILSLVR